MNSISVIDIGTSKIAVLTGNRGINNTLKIIASSFEEYAGYYNGEFVEPEKLNESIINSLSKAEINAGTKINKARAKYGPENFEYSVLFKIESNNEEEIIGVLNKKEIEFIELFDSFYNGYNSTKGGENSYIRTEENR